ncbi:MAG: SPOR domain-containing protein [Ignavibacteriales bacterium]|nr:MAG: SPOR domain-containing protein [Ignavibacteriales bacterium]
MKRIIFPVSIVILISFYSCSSSIEETREEEIENTNEEETYVFDEIPENVVEEEDLNEVYLIQIGAFTTKLSAEKFSEESEAKLGTGITVSYNSDVNLFVVRLGREFENKNDAEDTRDEITRMEEFKDAWIVSVTK